MYLWLNAKHVQYLLHDKRGWSGGFLTGWCWFGAREVSRRHWKGAWWFSFRPFWILVTTSCRSTGLLTKFDCNGCRICMCMQVHVCVCVCVGGGGKTHLTVSLQFLRWKMLWNPSIVNDWLFWWQLLWVNGISWLVRRCHRWPACPWDCYALHCP